MDEHPKGDGAPPANREVGRSMVRRPPNVHRIISHDASVKPLILALESIAGTSSVVLARVASIKKKLELVTMTGAAIA